jgi:hypothetical protein
MSAPPRRSLGTTAAALAAGILAAFALRAWRVGLPALTSDEAFSWRLTRHPLGDMLARAALDVHPPLYYVLLDGWLALLGDAPAALRGLSVVAGVLVVPLAFLLVAEARRLDGQGHGRGAALLAAALVALHATQVMQSRNARMYALGAALGAAGAWVLLRAHRATARRGAWWALWGLVAAAAAGTHYYLALTVAAQGAWAIAATRDGRTRAREVLLGAGVAALAFAPWVPALWRQVRQVHGEYWIPPTSASTLAGGLARWGTGADAGRLAPLVALLVVAALVLAARTGRAGRFLAVQAAAPWALGLLISAASGRPIVLDRYMVFAQVFLVGAWAVAIAAIPSRPLRVGAAAAACLLLALITARTLRDVPSDPPALAGAARALKRNVAEGDLVVVESPRVLNKLRYYAGRVDAGDIDVRSRHPERIPLSPYVSHVVSLRPQETIAADALFSSGARAVWTGAESTSPPDPPPPGWTITFARIFEGGGDTRFRLARYERVPAGP